MVSNTTRPAGWKASDFRLQGIDGKTHSLAKVRGRKGTVVVFICNQIELAIKGGLGRDWAFAIVRR